MKSLWAAAAASLVLFVAAANATDTVTNTTASNTVSSSSNTVSSSSNTVSNTSASNTVSSNTSGSTVIDKSPSTASAPSIVVNNSDVCVTGLSSAIQTSLFGAAVGTTVRDENCVRLKSARALWGMSLKTAAASLLCQDFRIFDAMEMASTTCPYRGRIGKAAQKLWEANAAEAPVGSRIYRTAIAAAKKNKFTSVESDDEYPK